MLKLSMSFLIMLFCLSVSAHEIVVSSERVSSGEPKSEKTLSSIVSEGDEDFDGVQDFTLVNRSGATVCQIYLSPDYDDNWGSNILRGTIPAGGRANVTVNGYGNYCMFDIKVVACNGSSVEGRFNLCQTGEIYIQ